VRLEWRTPGAARWKFAKLQRTENAHKVGKKTFLYVGVKYKLLKEQIGACLSRYAQSG